MTKDRTSPSARWFCWQRVGSGPWRRIASGQTEAEVRAAVEALPWHGKYRDLCYLSAGKFPWDGGPRR